jgi:endoglucanase
MLTISKALTVMRSFRTHHSSELFLYLDCGHADWPDKHALQSWLNCNSMFNRLTGIAMNVSNYKSTKECLDRAKELLCIGTSDVLPLIVDCSRNGEPLTPWLEDEDFWCNPVGARLGPEPFLSPQHFHAQLWIKRPGESDGTHNSGAPAGTFDLTLCNRLCGG